LVSSKKKQEIVRSYYFYRMYRRHVE
jgi:hypothetical protein